MIGLTLGYWKVPNQIPRIIRNIDCSLSCTMYSEQKHTQSMHHGLSARVWTQHKSEIFHCKLFKLLGTVILLLTRRSLQSTCIPRDVLTTAVQRKQSPSEARLRNGQLVSLYILQVRLSTRAPLVNPADKYRNKGGSTQGTQERMERNWERYKAWMVNSQLPFMNNASIM